MIYIEDTSDPNTYNTNIKIDLTISKFKSINEQNIEKLLLLVLHSKKFLMQKRFLFSNCLIFNSRNIHNFRKCSF